MTFDASYALRFINRARAASGLPALTELPFTGAVRVDERACVLARALQAEVGGSADPRFKDHFVVRLADQPLALAVAGRTGQPCNDRAEVLLPEPLARLAVAFDRGQVGRRDARYVTLGQLSFEDLETAAGQAAAVVGNSSAGPSTKRPTGVHRWPAAVARASGARRWRRSSRRSRPVHHDTISAAHGAGPAVSGPGRNGPRPGRPHNSVGPGWSRAGARPRFRSRPASDRGASADVIAPGGAVVHRAGADRRGCPPFRLSRSSKPPPSNWVTCDKQA